MLFLVQYYHNITGFNVWVLERGVRRVRREKGVSGRVRKGGVRGVWEKEWEVSGFRRHTEAESERMRSCDDYMMKQGGRLLT